MRRILARLLPLSLTAALAVIAVALPAPLAHAAPIDTTSRLAVASAYMNTLVPTRSVPTGWTGSVTGCNAGTTSAAHQQAVTTSINFHRAMAGLDPITLDPALEANAQQAALMMTANNSLSHTPPSTWTCYTAGGSTAARTSNIALGFSNGPDAIERGYIRDGGPYNTAVGHRRWVMLPSTRTMGSGTTSNANVLTVFGSTQAAPAGTFANPTWVPWPTAGYFPTQLEPQGRWSLSGNARYTYDFSAATVSVTGPDGATRQITPYPAALGYGNDSLVWEMGTLPVPTGQQVDDYAVSVTGILRAGVATSYTYTVRLFDATALVPGTVTISGTPQVDALLTANPGSWGPGAVTYSYQWLRSGTAITGATAQTYRPTAADVGSPVSVTVTATRTSDGKTGSATSGPTSPVVKAVFSSSPTVGISGTPKVGNPLTAQIGPATPAATSLTYQWLRDGSPVPGATAASYTLQPADLGTTIRVGVVASRPGYVDAVVSSAPTGPVALGTFTQVPVPTVSGPPAYGNTLSATTGTWLPTPTAFTYQWLRNGTAITGATGQTYGLQLADIGTRLSVRVTGTRAGFASSSATSVQVGPVALGTFAAAPTPTVTGVPAAGSTLTASPGAWSPSPATLTYQWFLDGVAVPGATASTLVVPQSSIDKSYTVRVTAGLAGYTTTVRTSAPTSSVTHGGRFVDLPPQRLLDTRECNGACGPIAGGAVVRLKVTGRGGVPSVGVSAVILNVTVTAPTAPGHVTAYPFGAPVPVASNLNFSAGQTVPNLVTVKVSADGHVALLNGSTGTIHLVADVAGYVEAGPVTTPGMIETRVPVRLLDTRDGTGAPQGSVGPYGSVSLQVTGRAGIPAGASAAILNVTVVAPTAPGHITVYPNGASMPTASNINFVAGQTVPNLVVATLSADGRVRIANQSSGSSYLIADVAGYVIGGTPTAKGAYVALSPTRLMDTRTSGPLASGVSVTVPVAGRAGMPSVVAAIVTNLTATAPTAPGFITAYPAGATPPFVSNVNFVEGQTVANLAVVKTSVTGLGLRNGSAQGTTHVVADVAGYFIA